MKTMSNHSVHITVQTGGSLIHLYTATILMPWYDFNIFTNNFHSSLDILSIVLYIFPCFKINKFLSIFSCRSKWADCQIHKASDREDEDSEAGKTRKGASPLHECQGNVRGLSNLNVCRLLPLFLQETKLDIEKTQCLAVEGTSEADKSPATAVMHEQMSLDYNIPKILTLSCT